MVSIPLGQNAASDNTTISLQIHQIFRFKSWNLIKFSDLNHWRPPMILQLVSPWLQRLPHPAFKKPSNFRRRR